jgi:hypothetical protein
MYARDVPDVRGEIARLAEAVHAVPANRQPPRPATIRRVHEWEANVEQVAAAIRRADDLIAQLSERQGRGDRDQAQALVEARAVRRDAFARMRALNPAQAWFWTEEWQRKEREADADIAAGRVIHFDSDEELLAFLAESDADAHA